MKRRTIFDIKDVNRAAAYVETQLRKQSAKAHAAFDEARKNQVRLKRDLLAETIQEAAGLSREPKSVFVSLAGAFRKKNFGEIQKHCAAAGFSQVHTGFDDDVHGDIKEAIMFKIMECHAFLGIWSNDFDLKAAHRGHKNTVPRVWMPLELGMALVLNKPYYLILHESTERSYLAPVQELVQGWYADDRSFDAELRKGAARLYEKALAYFVD